MAAGTGSEGGSGGAGGPGGMGNSGVRASLKSIDGGGAGSDARGSGVLRSGVDRRRLFYWVHTTSRQPFETGVQRVVRRLARGLGRLDLDVLAVGYDERRRCLEIVGQGASAFESQLAATQGSPLLFIPELTADPMPTQGVSPIHLGRAYGMRTRILAHDTLPLQLRTSHYSEAVVSEFEAYYRSFADADAVLTTTVLTAEAVRAFLTSEGRRLPPIDTVHLPAQFADLPRVLAAPRPRAAGEPLELVTVCTWEPRKNLVRMLRALHTAQQASPVRIKLTLVGLRGWYPAYDAEVDAALGPMSDVTVPGPLSDAALAGLIAGCDATLFPSLAEGFGLPVGESLWLGKPCLCHSGSAMAEVAPGGGTLMIDMTDEGAIVGALLSLATKPEILALLAEEARIRPLASWDDYASAVASVLSA